MLFGEMGQQFKSIYFPDYPASTVSGGHVTVAFGPDEADVFDAVSDFSGQELRDLLRCDRYEDLIADAGRAGRSVNAHCIAILRNCLDHSRANGHSFGVYGPKNDVRISAIQATFRGGDSAPLHQWYPYLEGYSPQFVEGILDRYASSSTVVLDPFSGTGTTPLAVSQGGRQAYFAEINPLLQFLTAAKVRALVMSPRARHKLADSLLRLADKFSNEYSGCEPSEDLRHSYSLTFGASHFFEEDVFERVLRCRTFIDDLRCSAPLVATLATVAVLASLVPSSLLKRAGDLRYKNVEEREREHSDFDECVVRQLRLIAHDLQRLHSMVLAKRPLLVAEDARDLRKLPALDVDAVVTSPPYLNGTNYFRNTKVELWFLRALRSRQDLSDFRSLTVTAGINDVSSRRQLLDTSGSVGALVNRLAENAYDPRIPRMVQSYFQDMSNVFDGVLPHLSRGAITAIDIGDSAYGGVHVPTDQLLLEMLSDKGFQVEDEILLRRRLSRGGFPLRQVLLILRSVTGPEKFQRHRQPWSAKWQDFKDRLPHQIPPYSKRNWGHPLHSLCSYQGKMKPALAKHLVDSFVPVGGTVLDPFAGVATIPFEAAQSGRRAFGFDISPTAVVIGMAKLGKATLGECEAVLKQLEESMHRDDFTPEELAEAFTLGFNGRIIDYFHPDTLGEVLLARRYFKRNAPSTPSEALVMASLLHILHGNRPYALSRRSHPITPFAPTGEFEYRALLPRLRTKVERSLAIGLPDAFVDGEMIFQDVTAWWPRYVQDLDAIITSPPFYDSTRFHLANWMRLWFAGWEAHDFKERPLSFVDEMQKEDFSVYEAFFRQSRERLKEGGVVVLHLGKSRKCDMAEELSNVAKPWFRIADRYSESVEHCESHGIRDKGTVEVHQYLVLN